MLPATQSIRFRQVFAQITARLAVRRKTCLNLLLQSRTSSNNTPAAQRCGNLSRLTGRDRGIFRALTVYNTYSRNS